MQLEREMRREPQNSLIRVPRFQRESGLLNPSGGSYSRGGMIDYPRFPISELHLGKFPTLWNFEAGKSTSRMRYVRNQQIFISQCTGSKKLRQQNQLTTV